MVGHDHIAGNPVILFLQIIKPTIYQVIAICFCNQGKPFITSKGYKEHSFIVWYIPAYRHGIKISICSVRSTSTQCPIATRKALHGDMVGNGTKQDSGQEKISLKLLLAADAII